MYWRSVIFISIFLGLVVYIIPNLLWLLSWLTAKIFSYKVPYAPFGWTALALMLIVWISTYYGYKFGRFQIEVNNVEYQSEDIPQNFDGYKIIHISDLHVDSFNDNPEALKKVVEKVNEQQADIILFTGDMNTGDMDNIGIHKDALSSFKAREGVVSVLGNHDFFIYCRQYHNNAQRCAAADSLTAYERETLGWKVLRNESLILQNTDSTQQIAIAGVDNINGNQGFKTIQKGDLSAAMKGLDGIFTVLMTHDPSHWKAEVLPKSHAQITLSGHTHAAQMRLFGWSLANFAFKECDGRYDENGRMLYVSAGIGCTAPFRIACPSEITVITLKKK